MRRFNSFHAINIFTLILDEWAYPVHQHNFHELIFIEEGTGVHHLNDVAFPYKPGDLFLLTPNDAHEFRIDQKTTFTYLKFTEQVFIEKLDGNRKTKWSEAVKAVIEKPHQISGTLINVVGDQQTVFALLTILKHEYGKKCIYSREAVLELFGALMIIVARNINEHHRSRCLPTARETEKIDAILAYIRLHTYDSSKMNIGNIATHFAMSPNYVSIYVKKHTGISIQQHIIHTKLKTAEQLLKQSRLNINEIAERLGFNDASHFNKLFKKYKHLTPSAYTR